IQPEDSVGSLWVGRELSTDFRRWDCDFCSKAEERKTSPPPLRFLLASLRGRGVLWQTRSYLKVYVREQADFSDSDRAVREYRVPGLLMLSGFGVRGGHDDGGLCMYARRMTTDKQAFLVHKVVIESKQTMTAFLHLLRSAITRG